MSNKTKQRIRARMARTGESYQAVVNANALRASASVASAGRAVALPCDVCCEDLLDQPSYAMVQWLYEREPPFRDVAALFFLHKGACDQLVRAIARRMELSDSWMDLADLIADDWYPESRDLRESKNWCASHEARLDRFFGQVARARESGWRPPSEPILNVSDPTIRQVFDRDRAAFEAKSVARWRAFDRDTGLGDRVRDAFAPEWLERPAPSDAAPSAVSCKDMVGPAVALTLRVTRSRGRASMHMNKNPSSAQLRDLLAACDDDAGHHMLWVGKDGEVHLDLIPAGLTPVGYFAQTKAEQKFRYESFVCGNGYVGAKAAANAAHVAELFNDLVERWQRGDEGMDPRA